MTEALVWNSTAQRYKLRCVNELWAEVDYQPDGLSARSTLLRVGAPWAARLYYREFTEMAGVGFTTVRRLREYANFTRFSLHARVRLLQQFREVRSKALWALALPVGVGAFLHDRTRLARSHGRGP